MTKPLTQTTNDLTLAIAKKRCEQIGGDWEVPSIRKALMEFAIDYTDIVHGLGKEIVDAKT